jgi:tRNA(fMet)-specific endonuclease VapC
VNVLVVDTSAWISYFAKKRHADEIDLALKEGRVHLSPIVAAELMSGKMRDSQKTQLKDFLAELPLCSNDLDHWLRVGQIRALLAAKGISVSTPDAHVAQCTLDLKGYLLTEDAIFSKIAKTIGLRLLENT